MLQKVNLRYWEHEYDTDCACIIAELCSQMHVFALSLVFQNYCYETLGASLARG